MNSFVGAYEGEGQEGLASNVHMRRRTFVVIWYRGLFFFFFFIHLLSNVVRVGGARLNRFF